MMTGILASQFSIFLKPLIHLFLAFSYQAGHSPALLVPPLEVLLIHLQRALF